MSGARRHALAVLAVLVLKAASPLQVWALTEPASWPEGAATLQTPDTPRHYLIALVDQPASIVADEVLGGMLQLPVEKPGDLPLSMTLIVDELLTPVQLRARFEESLRKGGGVLVLKDGRYILERRATVPVSVGKASVEASRIFPARAAAISPFLWALAALWAALIAGGVLLFLNRRRIGFGPPPAAAASTTLDNIARLPAVRTRPD